MSITLNYKYYLTNVKWTNDYKNVLCFADEAARNTYFNLTTIFNNITDVVNFNISNLYKTTIVIDSSNYLTAMQSNYIIINNSATGDYYFYFITNARQASSNRLELNIELDVFQQYYYSTTFVDCNIKRCKYPIGKYTNILSAYTLDNSNPINYLSEPFTFDTVYKKSIDMGRSNLYDLIYGWMYVFVDPSYSFAGKDLSDDSDISLEFSGYATTPDGNIGEGVTNNIGVMCFPLLKDGCSIKVYDLTDSVSYNLSDANVILNKIMSGNGGADGAHIYSIKISRRQPFTYNTGYSYSSTTGTFRPYGAGGSDFKLLADGDGIYATALFKVGAYYGIRFIVDTNLPYAFRVNVDASLMSNGSSVYDPAHKITTAQFMPAYIDFGDGNKMEIDLTKARRDAANYITLYYKEPITPDITRYSVCLDNDNWYSGDNSNGITYSPQTFTSDMSMIFTLDQWASYLANNKNFYAQGNFNTLMSYGKSSLSAVRAAGQLNYFKAAENIGNSILDTYSFVKNREFQVDNMKSAVDTVVNQNGSAIADLLFKGIQPSIVIYRIKDDDATRATKYMKMYGVNTSGLIDNIKNYMSSSSFKYAYMQADVQEISNGLMSLEVEKKLLKIFNDGVRLWFNPSTMYDFDS